MAKPNVGDQLVDALVAAGVRRIYGIAGDSLNAITDSVRRSGAIRWVHVRHEEVAAFAAGAEAHLTGQLAVCAGSCGPGNLHLINGLYDAHRSRVPVLAIAAQIPSLEIGSGYPQETHPELIFRECARYVELVSQAGQLPRVLGAAMQSAIGHRDVAVVVLPGDVAWREAEGELASSTVPSAAPTVRAGSPELAAAAERLNGCERVTILAGAGCADAHAELVAVAGALRAPVVHTMRSKEFVEPNNPFDVGMTGLLGFSSGYHAMRDSDGLLLLGTDFPYRQFYPEKAVVVQVDTRAEQIGRRTHVDLGVVGDVRSTLQGLVPLLRPKADDAHLTRSLAHYRKAREALDELAVGTTGDEPLHPQFVAKVLDGLAAPDAIFACDVGTPTIWAARYLTMNGRRRLIGSFTHASMANALPQAIGAQLSFPGRQVIAMSGDGGLAMLLGDLLTLRQEKLPVKVVVFNNGALGFVELEMKAAGILEFATELANPAFAEIAKAAGMLGLRVDTADQLAPALSQALAYDGPALVDVAVRRQELALPPSIRWDEFKGYSLYLVKAVLSGRGDEVVDLAKSTLFH
jgi:pyruvate dehydrogenase (quinone)